MKNILLLSPEYGLAKGGIQTWAYYINMLFEKNNYTIKSLGLKEIGIFEYFKLFNLNFKSDLFLLMTWKMIIGLLPILFFTNKKIFIFIHGNDILNLPSYQLKIFKYLIGKKNIFFIANSNAIAKIFTNIFDKEVDYIVPPFIDTKCSTQVVKNKNQFFTITRLVRRKNIANVIKVLKKLSNEGLEFIYYIGGSGPEKENLENLVKKENMSGKIQFLGRLTEEDKNKYLATSTLFLLPSIFDEKDGSIEGYGIVFIEANMFETPVVSGETGGMIEAVVDGKTGFYSSGSEESIYLSIKKVLNGKLNSKDMVNFANKHHYADQKAFLKFIDKEV